MSLYWKKQNASFQIYSLILTWSGLVILISMYFTIPLTTTFITEYDITETEAVWVGSSFSMSYAICCFLYGPLSDRFGRKIFLIIGICILTVVTFIGGFVKSYEILLFIRVLQAMAAAAFVPISLVYTAEVFPSEKRLSAIGMISSGFLIASVVAQVFAITIETHFGWRGNFFFLSFLYLITTFLVFLYLPKEKNDTKQENILKKYLKMKNLLLNPILVGSFIISLMLLFSLIGMYTILGKLLSAEPYNFTDNQILYVRGIGILGTFTSFFASKIAKKVGFHRAFRTSFIIAAASLFLIGLGGNPIFVIFLSLVFVACISFIVPTNITVINANAETQRGSAVLFNAFILFVGASLGPLLATKLMNIGSTFMTFTVFSVILFIGFLCTLITKKD